MSVSVIIGSGSKCCTVGMGGGREGRSDLLPVLNVLHRFCRVGHGREMELDTGTFQAINELKFSSNRKVLKVELSSVSVPKYHWNCRN